MAGRQIFIGDVHGHYDGLMQLFDAIAPGSDDHVHFLGDLIDRGPKSSQVVEFVKSGGYPCVLGNHEQLLLDAIPNGKVAHHALQAWLYSGGQTTVSSYKNLDVLLEDLSWIRSLPTYLDLGNIFLAHAGVHPGLPIAEQTTQEFCWIREEFHSISKPYFANKLIITGHTITFTLPDVPPGAIARGRGWIDIDTGAYHPKSGWLTALDMTNELVYQVQVFRHHSRVLPFTEAVVQVEPEQILARRKQLLHR